MQQNIKSKAFGKTEDLVCKLYIQSVSIFLAFFERSLLSYWSMNLCQELGLGWRPGYMHVDVSRVFYMNITMVCAYCFS